MAYKITTKPNTIAPSAEYPFGDIRNNTGGNNGTPVNRLVYADFHQFFAKMAAEAAVTLNDLPDNATNGFQFFEALQNVIRSTIASDITVQGVEGVSTKLKKAVIEIGSWDMDADAQKNINNTLYGVDETNIISVNAMIRDDLGLQISPLICGFSNLSSKQGGVNYNNTMGLDRFELRRLTGGDFDSISYNSTSFNRGWVIVEYVV
jgi:hypothetical protein